MGEADLIQCCCSKTIDLFPFVFFFSNSHVVKIPRRFGPLSYSLKGLLSVM